jgi:hypothetical protein
MSDGERKLKKIWDAETRRPKAADGGLGHDELRDRWLELYPDIAFGGGEWRKYADGWWRPIEDLAVEAQVMDVLERSRDEGVKITRHLLGSVLKLGQLSVYVAREKWDADPDILVLANGALEVSSRRFREHRPEDYATSALPYDYDLDADCEIFRAVVGKALPDAVGFLQEFAGYCLTPNTSLETALWFKGPGVLASPRLSRDWWRCSATSTASSGSARSSRRLSPCRVSRAKLSWSRLSSRVRTCALHTSSTP